MEKIKTLSILGPTASGKTGVAIELAKRLNGEIVSCDSMQLYREMDIGTATPSLEEREGIVHHLFDIIDPEEEFSAADYVKYAAPVIEDIASRGKLPILCGGTGMYYESLMKLSSFFSDGVQNDELRRELYSFAKENGNEALHDKLKEIDPEAAEAIHYNNVKRVIRAIEIFNLTGKTKTETDKEQLSDEYRYDDTPIILEFNDRALLYERIEKRVDIMIEEGLEEETRKLFFSDRRISRTASQAIGYKELLPYIRGEMSLDAAIADLKLATRHYAKRQMIWFRRYADAIRVHPDNGGVVRCAADITNEIIDIIKKT